jgi:hypothetical protein
MFPEVVTGRLIVIVAAVFVLLAEPAVTEMLPVADVSPLKVKEMLELNVVIVSAPPALSAVVAVAVLLPNVVPVNIFALTKPFGAESSGTKGAWIYRPPAPSIPAAPDAVTDTDPPMMSGESPLPYTAPLEVMLTVPVPASTRDGIARTSVALPATSNVTLPLLVATLDKLYVNDPDPPLRLLTTLKPLPFLKENALPEVVAARFVTLFAWLSETVPPATTPRSWTSMAPVCVTPAPLSRPMRVVLVFLSVTSGVCPGAVTPTTVIAPGFVVESLLPIPMVGALILYRLVIARQSLHPVAPSVIGRLAV